MPDMIEAPPTQPDLPEDREATLLAGLKQYQLVAAERDRLLKEVRQVKTDNALLEVTLEGKAARITELESYVATANIIRDAKIAEAEKYKTICTLIMSVLRAHDIESAPVIKDSE